MAIVDKFGRNHDIVRNIAAFTKNNRNNQSKKQ